MSSSFLFLAVEITMTTVGQIAGAIFGTGGVGVGLKLIWNYWARREDERIAATKEVLDGKETQIKAKDTQIENLSKELSRKSDEHAKKVEELMALAMKKVEEFGEKNAETQVRVTGVMIDFTTQVRSLSDLISDLVHEVKSLQRGNGSSGGGGHQ